MRKLTEKEMLESEIPSTKELVLERQLKQLAAENRKLKSEKYDDEAICDALKDGIKALPKSKGKYVPKKGSGKKNTEHQAVLIVTDAHAEEYVSPEETEGTLKYDFGVFESRMAATVQKTIEITEMMRKCAPVTDLNVFYLGDWFQGEIHPDENGFGSTMAFPMAIPAVSKVIGEQITDLSAHFRNVNVYGVCGNHSRTSKKPVTKMRADRNWDTACYKIAEQFTSKQTNVKWNIPKSMMTIADVLGWKCLLTHGDCVKRTCAEPLFAISRMIDAQHRQRRKDGTDFDYCFVGHWHDDSTLHGECEICPPLVGGSQFSRYLCHALTPPGALLYFFTKEFGKTSRWRLNF